MFFLSWLSGRWRPSEVEYFSQGPAVSLQEAALSDYLPTQRDTIGPYMHILGYLLYKITMFYLAKNRVWCAEDPEYPIRAQEAIKEQSA